MYFESVFLSLTTFFINIYNINLPKKFMKIAFFLASKVGRPFDERKNTFCTSQHSLYP